MKIKLNVEELLSVLLPLQSIVNDNHMVPILQNVKLDFVKGFLYASGNNLEVSCINSVKTPYFDKESVFCINYNIFLSIIKSIDGKEVTINKSEKIIEIVHNKGDFEMPWESANEFPVSEKEQFEKKAKVNGERFRGALKVANKFVLNEDVDAMSNISLSLGKKVYIRSTDRNRLFEEKIKGSGDEENVLISGKSSLALFSLLEDCEDVSMRYNSNTIYFKFDNKEIFVLQQQGNFPIAIFTRVIDTISNANHLKVNITDLLKSLKRVSLMSSKEKYSQVKLEIGKNTTIVSCSSKVSSQRAEETLSSKFKKPMVVAFNYKYLIEILGVFETSPDLFIDEKGFLFITQKKMKSAIAPQQIAE